MGNEVKRLELSVAFEGDENYINLMDRLEKASKLIAEAESILRDVHKVKLRPSLIAKK